MLLESNYIKKAFSALLLVMLLFIHSVKLLHTHSGNSFFSNHSCSKADVEINDNSGCAAASDCTICSYQLSKDADDLVQVIYDDDKAEPNVFNASQISFHKPSFSSACENRGPPVSI